ncbi:unnamed protein product [Prunus brigantina]
MVDTTSSLQTWGTEECPMLPARPKILDLIIQRFISSQSRNHFLIANLGAYCLYHNQPSIFSTGGPVCGHTRSPPKVIAEALSPQPSCLDEYLTLFPPKLSPDFGHQQDNALEFSKVIANTKYYWRFCSRMNYVISGTGGKLGGMR